VEHMVQRILEEEAKAFRSATAFQGSIFASLKCLVTAPIFREDSLLTLGAVWYTN